MGTTRIQRESSPFRLNKVWPFHSCGETIMIGRITWKNLVLVSVVGCLCAHGAEAQTRVAIPAADKPLAAAFQEVYRVGGDDAPEWAAFERVFHVGFDENSRLYIADASGKRVVVVTPAG